MFEMPKTRRRRRLGPAALAAAALLLAAGAAQAQNWRTVQSARQLQNDRPVEVLVQFAAGELSVAPGDGELLYEMELRYDEDRFRALSEYDPSTNRVRLGLDGQRQGNRSINLDKEQEARIRLTRRVPVSLDVDFGAGEADLDLGGIALRALDLSAGASEATIRFSEPNRVAARTINLEAGAAELEVIGLGNARAEHIHFQGGVGSTTLDFTGAWTADAEAEVQLGVGSVTIRLPRGLGVQIRKSSFLTSFDADDMQKRGGAWYSRDWEHAEHQLVIDVQAAIGSIDVEWVD